MLTQQKLHIKLRNVHFALNVQQMFVNMNMCACAYVSVFYVHTFATAKLTKLWKIIFTYLELSIFSHRYLNGIPIPASRKNTNYRDCVGNR